MVQAFAFDVATCFAPCPDAGHLSFDGHLGSETIFGDTIRGSRLSDGLRLSVPAG
jgi:hypothetical protein